MAKRIIRLTESQLRQIVGKVINEQEAAAAAPGATPAPTAGPGPINQDDMAIAKELWRAVDGMGTYEDVWLTNTLKIADANQFWRVNAYLKQQHANEDYASCLNGDFGDEDGEVVDNCIKHLAKIGIQATATINGTVFTDDSFKIITPDPTAGAAASAAAAAPTDVKKQYVINRLFCSVKGGIIQKNEGDGISTGLLDDIRNMGDYYNLYKDSEGQLWAQVAQDQKFTQAELEAAKASCPDSELGKSLKSSVTTTPKQQAINTVFCSVKGGKINTPGQLGDGSPWSGYTALYQITPQEIEAAKVSCPDSELAKGPVATPRQKFFNDAFCSVKGGKIVAPGTPSDGLAWDGFVSYYKPTPEELAASKASCPDSELGKSAAPAVKPKAQWTKSDDNFPLKYGQFGAKIGEIQKDMGMSGDTYFGNTTEKGVLAKAPEYKRETGVTEDIFNKIKAASSTTATTTPTSPATGGATGPAPQPAATPAAAPPTEAELQASPSTLNPY